MDLINANIVKLTLAIAITGGASLALAADDDLDGPAPAKKPAAAAPAKPAPAPAAAAAPATPAAAPKPAVVPPDPAHAPHTSSDVQLLPHDPSVFGPDPTYNDKPYDFQAQLDIYGAKHANANQRPLLELGRELYQYGPFQPAPTLFGDTNIATPQVLVYGDWRTAVAWNDNGAKEQASINTRLNLDVDVRLTSTERIHAFFRPFDKNGKFTGEDFGGENTGFQSHFDGNADALFFEGDVGSVLGGLMGTDSKLDMPFAAGLMPLLFQNGVWLQDAFSGFAFTIPARNSRELDISNFDITFFAGFDRVTSSGLVNDDHGGHIFGVATFLEMMQGYWEIDYAYIQDDENQGRSFHSYGIAYTHRYFNTISNTVRFIGASGQDPHQGKQTADGYLLLLENSLITSQPSNIVPYFNFWAGFDHPCSAARDAGAGGILLNTGILFETDGLTGFPKMDDTGINTAGGAFGLNILGPNFKNQLVLETAFVNARGDSADRTAPGNEVGIGLRYQHPITNAIILRFDTMYAWRQNAENLFGARFEIRYKF